MAKKVKWWERPSAPAAVNFADDEEKAQVRAILSELSPDHQAVIAWADGNGCDHFQLTYLVIDIPCMSKRILAAVNTGSDRRWAGAKGNMHNPARQDKDIKKND